MEGQGSPFSTIESALEDIRQGKIIIVVDDEDRENEGDFVMAAQKVTPQDINFMAVHGRGLICTPLTLERAQTLHLTPMEWGNTSVHSTAFTVSVDLKEETTTGISAYDRAKTIEALVDERRGAQDFLRPGHVFPLVARSGGVLERPGHTEAAVDLAKLAGLAPVGVICEIMNEDGTMARIPELIKLSQKFNLKLVTIKDLCRYREEHEELLIPKSPVALPTKHGTFSLVPFLNKKDPSKQHLALVKKSSHGQKIPLVRIHSECLTGDIFSSKRCDCGEQLDESLKLIEAHGHGVLLYMRQEGRGIGLLNKLRAYALQEQGLDTVEANHELGLPADLRTYEEAAQMLTHLGFKEIHLLTNNPRKLNDLEKNGIKILQRIPLLISPRPENQKYLQAKKEKLGHMLLDDHPLQLH